MYFQHSAAIRAAHPELECAVFLVHGVRQDVEVADRVARHAQRALARLAARQEGDFPEIQAWRRAFARMGLKPTQYRCAAESLLRRLRKEGDLPRLHPLVELVNAMSAAAAVPIAVFDLDRVEGGLEVRHADGTERYASFSGAIEHPEPGEVIFADAAGGAHARRWSHRQGAASAVRDDTARVLLVAEAMHASARTDIEALAGALAKELEGCFGEAPRLVRVLAADAPRVDLRIQERGR